jgi:ABC-type transporter Mla MlaB component
MAADGRLVLEGELTIRTIEPIHDQLRERLAARIDFAIDVSGASPIDITFIQLALAARRSAAAAGISVTLAAPAGGALRDALARGGFLSPVAGHGGADDAWWFCQTRPS